jgi:hypothetical protein
LIQTTGTRFCPINSISIGIQDNDRAREASFGFLGGHDPVVRRYDLLSNPAQL